MDIFATVGTQLPFPRLMQALDQWAAEHPEVRVIAQTGADVGLYRHMVTFVGMGPAQFNRHMAEARIVVSCRATNRMRFRVNLDETRWWGCDGRRA